jgi:hypothetical protein
MAQDLIFWRCSCSFTFITACTECAKLIPQPPRTKPLFCGLQDRKSWAKNGSRHITTWNPLSIRRMLCTGFDLVPWIRVVLHELINKPLDKLILWIVRMSTECPFLRCALGHIFPFRLWWVRFGLDRLIVVHTWWLGLLARMAPFLCLLSFSVVMDVDCDYLLFDGAVLGSY